MKVTDISIHVFHRIFYQCYLKCVIKKGEPVKYVPAHRIKCRFKFFTTEDMAKLGDQAVQMTLDSPADIKNLYSSRLPWYRGHEDLNLSLSELSQSFQKKEQGIFTDNQYEAIKRTVETLEKNGITKNLEIISLYDTTINERLIVDGMTKVVALSVLYDQYKLTQMLDTTHRISCFEFKMLDARNLCPDDFSPLYRSKDNQP